MLLLHGLWCTCIIIIAAATPTATAPHVLYRGSFDVRRHRSPLNGVGKEQHFTRRFEVFQRIGRRGRGNHGMVVDCRAGHSLVA